MTAAYFERYRKELLTTLPLIDAAKVGQAVDLFREAREKGRTIFLCGNGGSAGNASHFLCDTLKGASYNRPKRFKAIALTDNIATITAYANDVSYDVVFVEQLKSLGAAGDVVVALSGSGNSPNVLRAFEYANSYGMKTIGLTGRDGGKLGGLSQLEIRVPVQHMGRIEDAHLTICHAIAYYFMETEAGA